jgi:hypothetical protein
MRSRQRAMASLMFRRCLRSTRPLTRLLIRTAPSPALSALRYAEGASGHLIRSRRAGIRALTPQASLKRCARGRLRVPGVGQP